MGNTRDRILKILELYKAESIDLSFAQNRARGNKGFFKVNGHNHYRIDIAKNITEDEQLHALVHEFAHYIHYCYDKTLKTVPYIENIDLYYEELSNITVSMISKSYASHLISQKEEIKIKIKEIKQEIIDLCKKNNIPFDEYDIKSEIKDAGAEYLLRYDKVKVHSLFSMKIYEIENLDIDFPDLSPVAKKYLLLNSQKRLQRRISNRINRCNKYYNSASELYARFIECYLLLPNSCKSLSPVLCKKYDELMENNKLPLLVKLKQSLI